MARIIADGHTVLGSLRVVIDGDQKVRRITCKDEEIRKEIAEGIANADGWMANDYHPEANTMLQAFAFLLGLFKESDVKVDGDIGEMPSEEGVVY